MRIERPQPLDLPAIADGVIRNNMGFGGLEVRVRGSLADGTATLADTGQQLPVAGGPPHADAGWLWFDGKAFALGEAKALAWLRATPGPVAGP